MPTLLHPSHWLHLWHSATGPINRDPADIEPLSWHYVRSLTDLLLSRRLHLSTYLWGLRARPASICGIGGTYAVAAWIDQ